MESVLLIESDFDRPMHSPSTLNLHSGSNDNFGTSALLSIISSSLESLDLSDLTVYRFPKPKLPRLPPIWAEVGSFSHRTLASHLTFFSPDRKYVKRSIGFAVIKVEYITQIM
jgi:hypothetical protein